MDVALTKEALHSALRDRVAGYLPSNARRYSWRCITRQPGHVSSALGIAMDPTPFTGKVIDVWPDGTLVLRKGRESTLCVVAGDAIAAHDARTGDEITVTPYARRRFDGSRCDTPKIDNHVDANGNAYRTSTVILGGHDAGLPVKAERSEYLRDMLEQVRQLPATDGFRRLEHVLVDANARNLRVVDPDDAHIISTPPTLECEVATRKFAGALAIVYDRGLDYYRVELRVEGAPPDVHPDIAFSELAEVVERLIDDGEWRLARIQVERRAAPPRLPRAA